MEHPYRAPPPAVPPPRPRVVLLALVTAGCLAFATFTTNKLFTMAQLRGDLPGIAERRMVISREVRYFGLESLEVELTEPGEAETRAWRFQIDTRGRTDFSALIGSEVRVRCLEAARECYGPRSVFISDANRAFDFGLLAAELLGLGAAARAIVVRVRTWRRAEKAVARPTGK